MFTDDTKLYRTIITEDDTTSLQDSIDSLVDWSAFWQLPFNELKCKCMHIGKDRTNRSYQMNDHVLENVKEIKDLGVITDQKICGYKKSKLYLRVDQTFLCRVRQNNTSEIVYVYDETTF